MSKDEEKPEGIGQQIGSVVDAAMDTVLDSAKHMANRSMHKARRFLHIPRPRRARPGSRPGMTAEQLGQMEVSDEKVDVTCIDYCPAWSKRHEVEDLGAFLAEPPPPDLTVRWIDIGGVSNPRLIQSLVEKYDLHPLAVEDVMNIPQRPKMELFNENSDEPTRAFIVARMVRPADDQVERQQVSIFLGQGIVITIQEHTDDVWDPIRERIDLPTSRLRNQDASYLVYTLLDAVVDHCYPILEKYSERLEVLEDRVMDARDVKIVHEIYSIKRELMLLARLLWPMRELVNTLVRDECDCISEHTRLFMRDVYDHVVQVLEMLETYRDVAGGLADTYHTIMGNRMNEVMKVLTIFATIFIPITFVAGVYGMNFDHIPELHFKWSYAIFWAICISIAGGMLIWFRKRKWL